MDDDDKHALANALNRLQTETAYSSWDTKDPRTAALTLTRVRCVRLADGLRRASVVHDAISYWIDATKDDPVPEVRYALEDTED